LLSEQEYQNFGKNFDLQLLGHIHKLWLNILHLHGDNVMFDLLADYPISVMNWYDQETLLCQLSLHMEILNQYDRMWNQNNYG